MACSVVLAAALLLLQSAFNTASGWLAGLLQLPQPAEKSAAEYLPRNTHRSFTDLVFRFYRQVGNHRPFFDPVGVQMIVAVAVQRSGAGRRCEGSFAGVRDGAAIPAQQTTRGTRGAAAWRWGALSVGGRRTIRATSASSSRPTPPLSPRMSHQPLTLQLTGQIRLPIK
uniref:Uncharacterized protein n=1 Tax=Setaria italica TaxID=4555 RepID=K4AFZ2_SETIT